ncbi:unnamed protein product [Tetraodon nigroviridis]|uniref:(spotted green pufferfish) hypothetical protein n=1 Tax=Tetraodon nigroviridis TaxID=99883 RepID=Q4SBG1_TETNG|nr:unnamed protein product [Tetraodon nigroviridis]
MLLSCLPWHECPSSSILKGTLLAKGEWDILATDPRVEGAVEDQISMGSQIRISLIVECLRKMDGYGIEMGPESLRDPPIS